MPPRLGGFGGGQQHRIGHDALAIEGEGDRPLGIGQGRRRGGLRVEPLRQGRHIRVDQANALGRQRVQGRLVGLAVQQVQLRSLDITDGILEDGWPIGKQHKAIAHQRRRLG